EIEEVRAELQMHSLTHDGESLRRGEVEVHETRSVVLIASGGADTARGRGRGEIGLVENRVDIPVILSELARSDHVGTVEELVETAEIGRPVEDREWRPALHGRDA